MSRTEAVDEACPLEQTWYAGDVHFNEQIEFRGDATGTWLQGGMASDAPHARKEFRWERTASTLTVSDDDGAPRTVSYRIHRDSACYLTFKDHVMEGSGFRHFSDSGY